MKRWVLAGTGALLVLGAGCQRKPSVADKRGTWCEHVNLGVSPDGDRTRFENTAERVLKVKGEIHAETLGCGAYYVGVSSDAIMSAVIQGKPLPEGPGYIPNEDPSHCIVVYLSSDAPHPVANPLYTEGVRVYFVDDQIRAKVAQADAKATWCTDIPFSSDPTSDRTGVDNTEQRVKRIMDAMDAAVRGCPNVLAFDRLLNRRAVEELRLDPRPVQGAESKTWVLRVLVKSSSELPATNPLYLDGVRTYFGVKDLPPPPPPPVPPGPGEGSSGAPDAGGAGVGASAGAPDGTGGAADAGRGASAGGGGDAGARTDAGARAEGGTRAR